MRRRRGKPCPSALVVLTFQFTAGLGRDPHAIVGFTQQLTRHTAGPRAGPEHSRALSTGLNGLGMWQPRCVVQVHHEGRYVRLPA